MFLFRVRTLKCRHQVRGVVSRFKLLKEVQFKVLKVVRQLPK